jgi:hypothetical protein
MGGGDDDPSPPSRANTYFISTYGFTDESFCYNLLNNIDETSSSDESLAGKEYSFQEVKDMWLRLKTISGVTLGSMNGSDESSLRDNLMIRGLAPSQVNAFMGELNSRKNNLLFFYSGDSRYCLTAMYFEKE